MLYGTNLSCNIRYGFYPINTHMNHPCKFRKLTYLPPEKNDSSLPHISPIPEKNEPLNSTYSSDHMWSLLRSGKWCVHDKPGILDIIVKYVILLLQF